MGAWGVPGVHGVLGDMGGVSLLWEALWGGFPWGHRADWGGCGGTQGAVGGVPTPPWGTRGCGCSVGAVPGGSPPCPGGTGGAETPRSVPQNNPPYNMGAFRFELTFSPHHPLEPPRARLLTSIYHPGVSKDGHVCQPLTSSHCWQASTRAVHGGCLGLGGAGVRRIWALTPPDPPVFPPQCCRTCCCCWTTPMGSG